MIKIVEININDILADEVGCSEIINKSCRRLAPRYVTGLCSNGTAVFVSLEERPDNISPVVYRLAPLSSHDRDEIAAEMTARYHAGFTTIGSFEAENRLWGLFARPVSAKEV